MPQLNELNDKELKAVLKSYAALEVSVLDERDGIEHEEVENKEDGEIEDDDEDNDNEEEGEEDEEDWVEDDNEEGGEEEEEEEGQEDRDNCNECKKEHFWDFILEARDILKDNKKELLERYIAIAENNF